MSEPRNIKLAVHSHGGTVEVGGHDVSNIVRGGTLRFNVGHLPTLELDLLALDVTDVTATAGVRYLLNGVEFSGDDVRRAKDAGLHGLGVKLARVLGIDYDELGP